MDERTRAILTVCSLAHDVEDARELVSMLGLREDQVDTTYTVLPDQTKAASHTPVLGTHRKGTP